MAAPDCRCTEAVAIGIKIAGALETAHRGGILHRDVKPQNILVTEFGEPALADFGVAMLQSSTQTTAGLFDFTTLHAAPELLEGGGTSAATDVYELASSLYQLIAGQSAFRAYEGESPASVILRILRDPVRPLSGAGVPVALSDLLIRAMSKKKAERPPTAAEFAAELADIEIDRGLEPHPVPHPRAGAAGHRRRSDHHADPRCGARTTSPRRRRADPAAWAAPAATGRPAALPLPAAGPAPPAAPGRSNRPQPLPTAWRRAARRRPLPRGTGIAPRTTRTRTSRRRRRRRSRAAGPGRHRLRPPARATRRGTGADRPDGPTEAGQAERRSGTRARPGGGDRGIGAGLGGPLPAGAWRRPRVRRPAVRRRAFAGADVLAAKTTLRAGASAVTVTEHPLRLRTWFKRSEILWTDVQGFEAQLDNPDAQPAGTGQIVALTALGPVEIPGTRRPVAELRYVHALLDAYRILRASRVGESYKFAAFARTCPALLGCEVWMV